MVNRADRDPAIIRLTNADWPIVLIEFPEKRVPDEGLLSALGQIESLMKQAKRNREMLFFITDLTQMRETSSANQRKLTAEWMKRTAPLSKAASVGTATVTRGIMAGIATATHGTTAASAIVTAGDATAGTVIVTRGITAAIAITTAGTAGAMPARTGATTGVMHARTAVRTAVTMPRITVAILAFGLVEACKAAMIAPSPAARTISVISIIS